MNKNKLITESRVYRLTGLTPILGSAPASRAIRTQYIASKAPTDELRTEEENAPFDLDEKGLTVFNRSKQDHLCLMGYQIKGFLKGALTALKAQCKIAAVKGKIDNLVFVEPRYIPLMKDGAPIREEDEILERPLRAQTMQGERVTLAASKLLERLDKRRDAGLTTPKQIRFLEGRGFRHVGTWTFDSAKQLIDRIAANNWRTPAGITPATYAPTIHILPSQPAMIEWRDEA